MALAVCAALAVWMTQPLATKAGTHLVRSRDTLVHYWNGWWVQKALIEGLPLYHSTYLFHPEGVSLVYHNIGWLNVAGWILLRPFIGGLAAHNVTLLFYVALCGLAAFLLARELTNSALAGLLAGVVYQNWPARLTRLNFPNLINTAFVPLTFLFLIRALRKGKQRDAVLAGLCIALAAYTRLQQLIPIALGIGVYLCFALLFPQAYCQATAGSSLPESAPEHGDPILRLLLVVGLIASTALLPTAVMLVKEQIVAPKDLQRLDSSRGKVTDLLAYMTPPDKHPYLERWTAPLYHHYYTATPSQVAYIGIIPLMLAVIASWRQRQASLPWLVFGAFLILLGLGPTPCINARCHPRWITFYGIIDRVMPLSLMRVPGRFNVFLALPASLLSAYGVLPLLKRAEKEGAAWGLLLVIGIGAISTFEYLPGPVRMERPHRSDLYRQLADDDEDYAILNVPLCEQAAKVYMFAQTQHGHPIVQGHVSRLPGNAWDTVASQPWLETLHRTQEMSSALPDVSRQVGMLVDLDVGTIVLHKTQVAPNRVSHWQRYLAFDPFYEDQQLAAFRTLPAAGKDFRLLEEPVAGLGPIRVVTSTRCVNPGGVLEVDVAWGTSSPPGANYDAALSITSPTGRRPAQVRGPLMPGLPTSQWPADAVNWGYYTLSVPSTISSGTYTVTLNLLDSATGAVTGANVNIGTVTLADTPCEFPVPPNAVPVEAVFGERLRLLAYRLKREGNRLVVVLYWRAEQRMRGDYKIFVHVFDPETSQPVAQDDAQPHRGAFPTQFWWPGEVVEDHVSVFLSEAPDGVYGIAVGAYDPVTMKRLPAVVSLHPHPDGRFELPGESVVVGTATD